MLKPLSTALPLPSRISFLKEIYQEYTQQCDNMVVCQLLPATTTLAEKDLKKAQAILQRYQLPKLADKNLRLLQAAIESADAVALKENVATLLINLEQERVFFNAAFFHLNAEEYQHAIAIVEDGLIINNSYINHLILAACYVNLGQEEQIQTALHNAEQLNPDLAKVYLSLGNAYITMDSNQAFAMFEKAYHLAIRLQQPTNACSAFNRLLNQFHYGTKEAVLKTAIRILQFPNISDENVENIKQKFKQIYGLHYAAYGEWLALVEIELNSKSLSDKVKNVLEFVKDMLKSPINNDWQAAECYKIFVDIMPNGNPNLRTTEAREQYLHVLNNETYIRAVDALVSARKASPKNLIYADKAEKLADFFTELSEKLINEQKVKVFPRVKLLLENAVRLNPQLQEKIRPLLARVQKALSTANRTPPAPTTSQKRKTNIDSETPQKKSKINHHTPTMPPAIQRSQILEQFMAEKNHPLTQPTSIAQQNRSPALFQPPTPAHVTPRPATAVINVHSAHGIEDIIPKSDDSTKVVVKQEFPKNTGPG